MYKKHIGYEVTLMGSQNYVQIISAVTREEHTGNIQVADSMKEAIEAAKISAHIIDIDKRNDFDLDIEMAKSRRKPCLGSNQEGCKRCNDLCLLKYVKLGSED